MNLRHATLVLFVLTLAFMLPFEYTITRVLGVICMVAFVVVGAFWIASPEHIEQDDDAPQPPEPGVTR
jgi:Ca2+/Na+ antiporter